RKRKEISRHIKKMRKSLGLPDGTFEAPIEQMDSYVYIINELLNNYDNDELLNFLNKRVATGKELKGELDNENLKKLTNIYAEAERMKLNADEKVLFDKWLQDQLSDDYYNESEKQIDEITNLVKDDFSLINDINNLDVKLKFQQEYLNDIKAISSLYRKQVQEKLLFESCFLEVVSQYEQFQDKRMFTLYDFLSLPHNIQNEINLLVEKRRSQTSEG
ncbi:hypothetical protein ACS2TZ_33680, partial [Bacillus cereus group sp. Bce025]